MLLKFHDLAIQKAILAYDCETKVHARSKSIVLQLDPGTCMVIKNPAGMCRPLKYFCYKYRKNRLVVYTCNEEYFNSQTANTCTSTDNALTHYLC